MLLPDDFLLEALTRNNLPLQRPHLLAAQQCIRRSSRSRWMAKSVTKAEARLWATLLLIGLPIFLLIKFFEATGVVIPLAILAVAIVFYVWYKSSQRKRRMQYLTEKYQDPAVVRNIMNGSIWQGQTAEQLRDSIGTPTAVDRQLLKTKKKEIWKYFPRGVNRFSLRVTLENDSVVGWDKKA